MLNKINSRFGTWRGLVRLLLAYAELLIGRLTPFRVQNPQAVQRLVFVCLGNICRSAFAEKYAAELGLNVASLGLSTTTGNPSPHEAVNSAHRLGIDLRDHRATNWNDFNVLPGDLFIVMEIRHAHEIRLRLKDQADVDVTLLGLWCSPPTPHLHDPFSLTPDYFDTCFSRVRQAVDHLSRAMVFARRQGASAKYGRVVPRDVAHDRNGKLI